MRFVAKNFFTVIVVADLSTDAALYRLSNLLSLVNQNLPARVGFLPVATKGSEAGADLAKIVRYVSENRNPRSALQYVNSVCYDISVLLYVTDYTR